jgi:hypothetical protein
MLSDEKLREIEAKFNAERVRTSDEEYLVIYPSDYHEWQRAIEAEVRKQYDALIRQMLDALENLDGIDTETECVTIDVSSEITAARARLEQS